MQWNPHLISLFLFIGLFGSSHALQPLGSVSGETTINCQSGFSAGSVCYRATVNCPGTVAITVRWGILDPAGTVQGTIVLHGGGGGTGSFDNGYVNKYKTANFRTIQVRWATDWEYTGSSQTKSIKNAACRPATILKYLFDNHVPEQTNAGYCYHGHSGGSGVGGYALAHYGSDTLLDAAILSAGPVFSKISDGCSNPSGAPVNICPALQYGCSQQPGFSHTPAYGSGCSLASSGSGMGYWTGFDCGPTCSTNPSAPAAWQAMSVVSTGADYTYPNTALSQWICKEPTNNSGAQGQYFASQITAANVPIYLEALVDTCNGSEGVWAGTYLGTNALTASSNWMISNCVPRHSP